MAVKTLKNIMLSARTAVHVNRFSFSTSTPFMIKWRFRKGIEPNPNRFGPLTHLPDYSYIDGRTVPIGSNLYKRMKLQKMYFKQIIDQCNEIDAAIEDHKQAKEQENIAKEKMIKSRLKEKGEKLKLHQRNKVD